MGIAAPAAGRADRPVGASPGSLMAVAVEVDRVRGCLLENIGGAYRLAAWMANPRGPSMPIDRQITGLCRQMGDRLGRRLWDSERGMPWLESDEPMRRPPLGHFLVAASPQPRLRVWLCGLSQGKSVAAARLAVTGSPALIAGSMALDAESTAARLAHDLDMAEVDVIVVTGGFDTPEPHTHQPVIALCAVVAGAVALLPAERRPAIFYAGNQWAAPVAMDVLQRVPGLMVRLMNNVLPAPGTVRQDSFANVLAGFYRQICRRTPGYAKLEQWASGPVPPATVESCFARLVQGWMRVQDLPELHGVYCAGDRWLHVWTSEAQEAVTALYLDPQAEMPRLPEWPPPRLVSGAWPDRSGPPLSVRWWDRSGMAPLMAIVGQVAPQAMVRALYTDLFVDRSSLGRNA